MLPPYRISIALRSSGPPNSGHNRLRREYEDQTKTQSPPYLAPMPMANYKQMSLEIH
jgi:hypothetical protein